MFRTRLAKLEHCRIHHLPAEAALVPSQCSVLVPRAVCLAAQQLQQVLSNTLAQAASQADAGHPPQVQENSLEPCGSPDRISLGSPQFQERLEQVLLSCCSVSKECLQVFPQKLLLWSAAHREEGLGLYKHFRHQGLTPAWWDDQVPAGQLWAAPSSMHRFLYWCPDAAHSCCKYPVWNLGD